MGRFAPTVRLGLPPVPHFLIDIHGNAHLAMGLLAKAGIQNIVNQEAPTERVTARLSAETPEAASGRVLAVLGGEPFTIDPARLETA
jgi:hypothetical protein